MTNIVIYNTINENYNNDEKCPDDKKCENGKKCTGDRNFTYYIAPSLAIPPLSCDSMLSMHVCAVFRRLGGSWAFEEIMTPRILGNALIV